MPELKGKTHYLMKVDARDYIKDKVTGCYLTHGSKSKTSSKRPNIVKNKKETPNKEQKPLQNKQTMTKFERKAKHSEQKQVMKEIWITEMESEEETKGTRSVPSHFKRYTIQDRKIVVQ